MKKVAVVVDAYSTGRLLVEPLKRKGFTCLHVQSTNPIPSGYLRSFQREAFAENFVNECEWEDLVSALRPHHPTVVLCGTESGVELADYLSERLGCLTNGTKLSAARRDKFKMQEVLRQAGLPHIKQFLASNLSDAQTWVSGNKLASVILKPTKSAGTDSVFLATSAEQIESAFLAIHGTVSQLRTRNDAVLLQAFVEGDEYIVDTVSSDGEHFVVDIWRYHKVRMNGGFFIYDTIELLPAEGEAQSQLMPYVKKVLEALHIAYGPAHSEVILTKEGPVLVEVGARMSGGDAPIVVHECTGTSQLDLTIDTYCDPFAWRSKTRAPYRLDKHALVVHLISGKAGTVSSVENLEALRKLSSFFRMSLNVKPGMPLQKTKDLFTSPGRIDLVHENPKTLDEDYRTIRRAEIDCLYECES